MWKVGFHFCSLPMMNALSGLVDVREAVWLAEEGVLLFVVENKDCTGALFNVDGGLVAKHVGGHMPTGQPLMVKGPDVDFCSACGGNGCRKN